MLCLLLLIMLKRFPLPGYLILHLCQSSAHLSSSSNYCRMQSDSIKKVKLKKKKIEKVDQLAELRWQELLGRKRL